MQPILYTFRRCPYAIRARLAIAVSGVDVLQQEVSLRDKPPALLACSPKGTVPVLQLSDGRALEQSLDIMRWALALNDPDGWLIDDTDLAIIGTALIAENDGRFKFYLDRYKYADRYPEYEAAYYREQGEQFLSLLNSRLVQQTYLMGNRIGFVDMAILPFIRQFAHVDRAWFSVSPYPKLIEWLNKFLSSALFIAVMEQQEVTRGKKMRTANRQPAA